MLIPLKDVPASAGRKEIIDYGTVALRYVTHVPCADDSRSRCALFSDVTVDKRIAVDAIKPITNAKLHKELLKFEEGCVRPIHPRCPELFVRFSGLRGSRPNLSPPNRQHVYRYKFGVLFCRQGQTKENDMFANSTYYQHTTSHRHVVPCGVEEEEEEEEEGEKNETDCSRLRSLLFSFCRHEQHQVRQVPGVHRREDSSQGVEEIRRRPRRCT